MSTKWNFARQGYVHYLIYMYGVKQKLVSVTVRPANEYTLLNTSIVW